MGKEKLEAVMPTAEEILDMESLARTDPEWESTQIDPYGELWLDYMEETYPQRFSELRGRFRLYGTALAVNLEAKEMKKSLIGQYRRRRPRPQGDQAAMEQYDQALRQWVKEVLLTETVYQPR
jgi:hypothetical protein